MLIKYTLSIKDGRQKSEMAATKFSFFDISTSDGGYFPRIIEIALFTFDFNTNMKTKIHLFTKPKPKIEYKICHSVFAHVLISFNINFAKLVTMPGNMLLIEN